MTLALKVDSEASDLERIIAAGEELVFSQRHNKVTLEEIVRFAGLPKDVIGALVSTKEELYRMIVRHYSRQVQNEIFAFAGDDVSTEEYLVKFAEHYLRRILHPNAIKAYRFAAGLASEHPDIAGQFRQTAEIGYEQFARQLETETDITIPEGMTYLDASHQFYALCRGALHHMSIFKTEPEIPGGEIKAQAQKAVGSFLRAFPPKNN